MVNVVTIPSIQYYSMLTTVQQTFRDSGILDDLLTKKENLTPHEHTIRRRVVQAFSLLSAEISHIKGANFSGRRKPSKSYTLCVIWLTKFSSDEDCYIRGYCYDGI
jgi:hypothetical protein